jgi:hypothetical protein
LIIIEPKSALKPKPGVSPLKKGSPTKKPETAKQTTKNKFAYKPIDELDLQMKHPPRLVFNPDKRDIHMMIKKATTLPVDDVPLPLISNP